MLQERIHGYCGETKNQAKQSHRATSKPLPDANELLKQNCWTKYGQAGSRGCSNSVRRFVRLGFPLRERRQRLFAKALLNPENTFRRISLKFLIEESIVEPGFRRIVSCRREINSTEPRPISCGQTHRAGLAARIEFALFQLECAQSPAGLSDRHDLSMSRRVVREGYRVPSAPDNFVLPDDDSSKRPALTLAHHLDGETYRLLHECFCHKPISYKIAAFALRAARRDGSEKSPGEEQRGPASAKRRAWAGGIFKDGESGRQLAKCLKDCQRRSAFRGEGRGEVLGTREFLCLPSSTETRKRLGECLRGT